MQQAVSALVYVLREALRTKCTTEALVAALRAGGASVWQTVTIKVLKHVWSERRESACALDVPVFNIGRLVSMEWKLGMSLASGTAKSIGRTFVCIQLKVADATSRITTHAFELGLTEFNNFSRQIKDLSTTLTAM